jgi:hypothetical protein
VIPVNKKFLTIIATLALFLSGGAIAIAVTGPADPPLTGSNLCVSGGAIRLDPGGPVWHENTRHNTVGFDTTVEPQINSDGEIHLSLEQTLDVVSLTVEEDETLSRKGVWAGGSGGVGHVDITMRKYGASNIPLDLNNSSDYNSVRGEYSNLWVTVVSVCGTEAG